MTKREVERFDVIVIGGGSAGCVAAARLSEDPRRSVLLLDAAPDPQPVPEIVASVAQHDRLLLESPYVTMYPTQRSIDRSTFYLLAGRIMGGGSSVNYMHAFRPTRADLDGWAARGNDGWGYDDVLPVLRRMESDRDFGHSPLHGSEGPLHIERPFLSDGETSDLSRAFTERARATGLPNCPDHNVERPLGFSPSALNTREGRRMSTAIAYLDPARGRPNLRIRSEALVSELVVDGRRVREVRYVRAGGSPEAAAADQVVLCAGAFRSPQLLMLSGIGPPAELERSGIRVAHALEGVGENYQDHATVVMTYEGAAQHSENWIVPPFRLIMKSDPGLVDGDLHVLPRGPVLIEGLRPLMSVYLCLLEQRNRGRVRLPSTDPQDLPIIETSLLEDPADADAMVRGMRLVHELIDDDSMRAYYGPMLQPSPGYDWERFARETHDSYLHGSGTCMMGPASDRMAVVDARLRVHGMEGLFVADASVIPTVPHANTNLTVIAIAERLAELVV